MPDARPPPAPTLPRTARLPINRCNLPAVILGSLTFQHHPAPLHIDGVADLHRQLFRLLDEEPSAAARARLFGDHMRAHFLLDAPEEAGFDGRGRAKANYLRLLRGWQFDPDGRDAAVLKGWVESRFGLLPRYHRSAIPGPESAAYTAYMDERTRGVYATNALEAQLDLVYAFCQYELARRLPGQRHIQLFRGVNRLDHHEVLAHGEGRRLTMLLNNVSSFSDRRERADEFGDHILQAPVPLAKVFYFNRLLPGVLKGEDEYVVLGGVYEVELHVI